MNTDDKDAIDPEFAVPDDVMRRMIQEALDDPRPSIPAEQVFARLRRHHEERMKARNARHPSR